MKLSQHQTEAFNKVMSWLSNPYKPYFVLDGIAGSGKTSMISFIRKSLSNTRVAIASYTGKATSVLKSKGLVDAQTIHSLIFNVIVVNGKYRFQLKESIPYDYIIIDEASMVNEDMFNNLLSFKLPIIFVGDSYQLPPVEGKNYFNVMDEHDVKLEEIVRQAAGNPIIKLADDVRKGNELFYLDLNNYGANIRKLDGKMAYDNLTKYDIIIVATNKSRNDINHSVRKILGYNPLNPVKGDKIICKRNKKGSESPYNGQLFTLRSDAQKISEEYDLLIDCETEEGLDYIFKTSLFNFLEERTEDKDDLVLSNDMYPFQFAYSLTAHNSQGSEYNNVLIVNDLYLMPPDKLTKCRWTYTAVTRAKEKLDVVDFGDLKPFLKYDLWGTEEKV